MDCKIVATEIIYGKREILSIEWRKRKEATKITAGYPAINRLTKQSRKEGEMM